MLIKFRIFEEIFLKLRRTFQKCWRHLEINFCEIREKYGYILKRKIKQFNGYFGKIIGIRRSLYLYYHTCEENPVLENRNVKNFAKIVKYHGSNSCEFFLSMLGEGG